MRLRAHRGVLYYDESVAIGAIVLVKAIIVPFRQRVAVHIGVRRRIYGEQTGRAPGLEIRGFVARGGVPRGKISRCDAVDGRSWM